MCFLLVWPLAKPRMYLDTEKKELCGGPGRNQDPESASALVPSKAEPGVGDRETRPQCPFSVLLAPPPRT